MKRQKRNVAPPRPNAPPKRVGFTDEQKKVIAVTAHEAKLRVIDAVIETLSTIRAEATYDVA